MGIHGMLRSSFTLWIAREAVVHLIPLNLYTFYLANCERMPFDDVNEESSRQTNYENKAGEIKTHSE